MQSRNARGIGRRANGTRDGYAASRAPFSAAAQYTVTLLTQTVTSRANLTLVFVLDGMRPDLFNPTDTPNLHKLREAGVNFIHGHSVFPTVTRVNSPSIATGMYPERAGIVGNSIFIPEIDKTSDLNTGDQRLSRADPSDGRRPSALHRQELAATVSDCSA